MRVRTLLYIILALGVVYPLATLFRANREVLGQPFHLWGGVELTVGLTLIIFMGLSMVLVVAAGLSREFGRFMEHRRLKRAGRKQDEIEEEYSRGLAAVLEGREDDALRHFRAVLERDSRHFNTLLKLGEVLRSQRKHAEAIEYHRKAHHLKEDDSRPLYALVEDYEAKGEMDRALAVLGKILGLNKQSRPAWRKLRALHVKERNWGKALEAQEKVEKLATGEPERDGPDARVGRGIRYEIASEMLEKDRPKEAAVVLRRLLKEDPRFIPAHVRLGEALLREGKDAEALEAWYNGFEATHSPVLLGVLEDHFLGREQPMAAIEALKRCIAGARKDTIPRFYLGKLYFRLEMLDDALEVLSSLRGRAAYAPSLHYLLGRIHERRKNWADAAAEYRRVVKEMELVQLEYRCRACRTAVPEWSDRCGTCGEWNTIEVDFREEISLEELGLAPAPVYGSWGS